MSFTLAGDWVGGPEVGWIRTGSLEQHVGGQLRRDLTVQAAVAISGAAFASAMGRQARAYQTRTRSSLATARATSGSTTGSSMRTRRSDGISGACAAAVGPKAEAALGATAAT